MSHDEYQIISYDQEDNKKWYANVLHICNQKPIAVYRVPSDPPMYTGMENLPSYPKVFKPEEVSGE